MDTKVLKDALIYYITKDNISQYELREVVKGLDDLCALHENALNNDDDYPEIQFVSDMTLLDLCNLTMYDTFGELARNYNGNPPVHLFARRVHERLGLASITYKQFKAVADFLGDLWRDNETIGANDESGKFKRSTSCT